MMHPRCLVLLLLVLPSDARRSIRVDDLQQGSQQRNNILANVLDVSAQSRDALIPGGLGKGLLRRAGQRRGALRDGWKPDGRLAGRDQPQQALPRSRAAPLAMLEDYVDTSSPLAKLAIAAVDTNNRRNQGRDVSMMAAEEESTEDDKAREKLLKVFSEVDANTKEKLLKVFDQVDVKARETLTAGITSPMGFFDPLGFATEDTMTGNKLLFYREVELKHGRVAMLASLGILVGEQFHPLFGGNIDVPSYVAFQETPLQTFWPAVVFAIAIPEIFSVFQFQNPALFETWSMKPDHMPGDLGFDPLGLKPEDPEELLQMRNKELNNGRLAMIAAAGMIAQELATGQKLF